MYNPVKVYLKSGTIVPINSEKRNDSNQGITFFDINGDILFFPYSSIDYLEMGPDKE